MFLVSACLLGINCKYNGGNNKNKKVIEFLKNKKFIMVCPEELAGLGTPRIPCELIQKENGDIEIINKEGKNLTKKFLNGANEVCVDLFLNEKIKYLDIPTIVEECMEVFKNDMEVSLRNIIDLDKSVREYIMNKYS